MRHENAEKIEMGYAPFKSQFETDQTDWNLIILGVVSVFSKITELFLKYPDGRLWRHRRRRLISWTICSDIWRRL
jgi:hypothetical protein